MRDFLHILKRKWGLAIKVVPILVLVLLAKLLFHSMGWEIISLNPLFTSIVAATIFLLGFLISGVLSDYKESEKIPGELSCSIEALYDEVSIIYESRKAEPAKEFQNYLVSFLGSLNEWFYKKERTIHIFEKISGMNRFFLLFEPLTQANFIVRMKQEQNNIRRLIVRTHTIRETSFVASAYAIVEALIFFLIAGMMIVKIEPFYESLFFAVLVSFMTLYMIFLLKDLDDPFEYQAHGETGSEVSLKPLHDLESRLKQRASS